MRLLRKPLLAIALGVLLLGTIAKEHDKIQLREAPVPVIFVKDVSGFYGECMQLNRNTYLRRKPGKDTKAFSYAIWPLPTQ